MFSYFYLCLGNCQFSFSHLGFWSGNFFLIAPFPDHCLLVPFYIKLLQNEDLINKKIESRLFHVIIASQVKNHITLCFCMEWNRTVTQ